MGPEFGGSPRKVIKALLRKRTWNPVSNSRPKLKTSGYSVSNLPKSRIVLFQAFPAALYCWFGSRWRESDLQSPMIPEQFNGGFRCLGPLPTRRRARPHVSTRVLFLWLWNPAAHYYLFLPMKKHLDKSLHLMITWFQDSFYRKG